MSKNESSQPQSTRNPKLTSQSPVSQKEENVQIYPPPPPPPPQQQQQLFYTDPSIHPQYKDCPRISRLRPEYYPASNQTENMMMTTHLDTGYGYMPQPVPAYSAAQSYHSGLTAMPGYFPDLTKQISAPRHLGYLSNASYPRYQPSAEEIQRRRRRNSTERRHHAKLVARKSSTAQTAEAARATSISSSRTPSLVGARLEQSPIQTSPVDMFTTQAQLSSSTYVTDHLQRAASYDSTPTLVGGEDYRNASSQYGMTQQAMSSPPTYPTSYTMATMSQPISSFAPASLVPSPIPQHTYPVVDRSSPPFTTPMQPGNLLPPPQHVETILVDARRDKPQCWDHGCNGREFSTFSNLLRHQREKSGSAAKAYCPRCGAEFTRTTARNGHMEHGKCKSRRASVAGTSTLSQSGSIN